MSTSCSLRSASARFKWEVVVGRFDGSGFLRNDVSKFHAFAVYCSMGDEFVLSFSMFCEPSEVNWKGRPGR